MANYGSPVLSTKYSILPRHPLTIHRCELANGEPVEYEHGFALISFLGDETVAKIIFGPPNIEPILGVVALESAGIIVDPITQTLKRLHALPLK